MEELIDFFKSLRRGFDKALFEVKINELESVDAGGLDYEHFHSLLRIWLNLHLSIKKWISIGICLVPKGNIEEKSIDYILRWLLANFQSQEQINESKTGFVLDLLTAAMDSDAIDTKALYSGYELFCSMLRYEHLVVFATKLVYTLTKPDDVTRQRVLEILGYCRSTYIKTAANRQLLVLLGLFKSYKPEFVPEDIPAISIYTSLKKNNTLLMNRFQKRQKESCLLSKQHKFLTWTTPWNTESNKNIKREPLLPHIELLNVGSKQYQLNKAEKFYIDFDDPIKLLQYSVGGGRLRRPARQRAFLCNATGVTIVALADVVDQAFLFHDLHHLLTYCFLDGSSHNYYEKQDLLSRLVVLQRTLTRGVPIITAFLARYLLTWNEKDFFDQILNLAEWISPDNCNHAHYIIDALCKMHRHLSPLEQCALLKTLTNMYINLLYVTTKKHNLEADNAKEIYIRSCHDTLHFLSLKIDELYSQGLQMNPDDVRVLYSVISSVETMVRSQIEYGGPPVSAPSLLVLSLPLNTSSAVLLDKMATITTLYNEMFRSVKAMNRELVDKGHLATMMGYTRDLINCYMDDSALTSRQNGVAFRQLNPGLIDKLRLKYPKADASWSLSSHLAFAAYTRVSGPVDRSNADNEILLKILDQEFASLIKLIRQLCGRQ